MKKLLICFDVDGTLIDDTVFIWQTIHDAVGTDVDEREHWADEFWKKNISYAEWAGKDVQMWQEKGVTRGELLKHIAALNPMAGAFETLDSLKAEGHILGVISGSLDIALEKAFPDHVNDFAHIFLNRLQFDSDDRLLGVNATPFDIEHKADGLVEMSRRTGIPMEHTVFIGDNFNDVSVAKLAGLAIAFNCKSDELAQVSDVVVPAGNLKSILPLIQAFANEDQVALNSVIS